VPFALPAALTIGAIEATLHISYVRVTSDLELARTVVTTVAVLCGLLLILFVEPPTRAWTGGDTLSGDWRPVALVGAMLALFAIFIGVPAMRDLFALTPLGPIDLLIIGAVVTAWAFGIRYAWRARLMPRMLGLDVR
jgi:cation-transporting P-type ATPase E